MPQIRDDNDQIVAGSFSGIGTGQQVAYTGTAGTIGGPVHTPKGILTSTGVAPSDGDTVTIGASVYTFKTALTPTGGEVLIGASAAAALLNLIRAINHSGTTGTDYANAGIGAAANPDVVADIAVTASVRFTVYAKVSTAASAALATTKVAVTLSWGAATLAGQYSTGPSLLRVSTSAAAFVKIAPTAVAAQVTDFPMGVATPVVFRVNPGDYVSAIAGTNGNLNVIEVF